MMEIDDFTVELLRMSGYPLPFVGMSPVVPEAPPLLTSPFQYEMPVTPKAFPAIHGLFDFSAAIPFEAPPQDETCCRCGLPVTGTDEASLEEPYLAEDGKTVLHRYYHGGCAPYAKDYH